MRDVTLVTGASQGIGAELARALAADGVDLALTARSAAALEALADAIAATGRPRPLVLVEDLAVPGAADRLAEALAAAGARATGLVNNAGYGLNGEVADLPRAEQGGIIDLNSRALVDLTLRLLPDIIAARGRILNVASTAAFQPGPGMAVYYASKAFVLSFSEA
ncbi:MAG: SDR family NAD(P)-dependent oxidoreductase, partial [Alsobacter sp.]